MTDKTKQAMGKAKAATKDKAAELRLHYLEMLRQAKQYPVPKLRAGDTNSQLEQISTLLGVALPTVGTTQQHVQHWHKLMVEDGVTELTECTPLEAAVCILMCWRAQQQRTKPTAMDKYQAGARIVNERRAAVLEEFKQQKEER